MVDVVAYAVGPDGISRVISPAPLIEMQVPEGGYIWVHVTATGDEGRGWLSASGLDPLSLSTLSADETRPRCTVHGAAALIYLRGVNLNPGAEPEDMVALRIYLSAQVLITVERRSVSAVGDLVAALERGAAPVNSGELVAQLALRLSERADPVVAALNERIDDLEDAVLEASTPMSMRGILADIRREAILLRRYMFPQRDALATLGVEEFDWLGAHARARLREATDRATRLAEDLDAIRDRAEVVHDQVMDMRAEQMNRQMLLLTAVSAIFLPITFLTGLLGINVGGIPGAHSRFGFWAVVMLLVALTLLLIWRFRRLGLFGGSQEK